MPKMKKAPATKAPATKVPQKFLQPIGACAFSSRRFGCGGPTEAAPKL
jgi:hypothetical protein